jgi:integrase
VSWLFIQRLSKMPRPKKDGTPARPARRRKLTEKFARNVRGEAAAFAVWDTYQRGLAIRVQPTGQKSWKAVYSLHGRARWLHIGDADKIGLADARRIAAKAMLKVAEGGDPLAERQAQRGSDTFAELIDQYAEHAKKKNKAWQQGDALLRRHLLPRWGNLKVRVIARRDVRAAIAAITSQSVANQTMKALSAFFTWAIREEIVAVNPVKGVEQHATQSRERILSDAEIPQFWQAFDDAGLMRSSALKTLLLTGQRPGEICHMRREHVADGWWTMPGKPDAKLGWPGTKNHETHRIWLPAAVQAIVADLTDDATGFVFATERAKKTVKVTELDEAMRDICKRLGVELKATPHDLRRTHGSTITRLGFGREAMNRIQNHKEGGIADIYDRHEYADENRRVMERVADHIIALAEGRQETGTVIRGRFS